MELDNALSANIRRQERRTKILLACSRGIPPYGPQIVAGLLMTTDVSSCLDNLTLPERFSGFSAKDNFELPCELVDSVFGNNPPTRCFMPPQEHPIARCSQLEPVADYLQCPHLLRHN